jgi:hypothetical protein
MADAITEAIQSSMAEAGLTGGDEGLVVDEGSSESEAAPEATEAEAGADAGAEGSDADGEAEAGTEASPSAAKPVEKPAAKPVEKDAAMLAREQRLKDLGLTPPKPGQKENRLPHSRVSTMVEKAYERGRNEVTAEVTTHKTRADEAEAREARLNLMADQDPDRFIEALAVANPSKWKPIQARLAGAPVAASASALAAKPAGTDKPKPNFKLPDGSMTYDEDGVQALLDWTTERAVAQAEEKITKQFEARFGPIEQSHKAVEFRNQQAPIIAAKLQKAREDWGALFEADYKQAETTGKSDILTYQKANKCSFEAACQAVLLPRLRADRNKMREELIAEINEAPEAATERRAAVREQKGPRSLEQVIKDSMVAAGI